jgi:5-methylcytosine-specific restriction endonuclease McrA
MQMVISCKTCGEKFVYAHTKGRLRRYCDYCQTPKHKVGDPLTCQRCGVVFTGRFSEYCQECRPIVEKKRRKERDQGRAGSIQIAVPESKLCPKCQQVKPASAFTPQRDRPNGLSGTCKACRAKVNRDAHAAGKWKPAPRLPKMRACPICSKTFDSVNGAKYCSDECDKEDKRRKAYIYDKAKKAIKERECKECGAKFMPEYGDKKRTFCSQSCLHKHGKRIKGATRRARIRGASKVDNFDPIYILKRDGWRCYICGCATPRKLRGTCAPNSPQVDHVIPIARGGAHTEANVRCICRACNIAKSDKLLREMNTTMRVQLRSL